MTGNLEKSAFCDLRLPNIKSEGKKALTLKGKALTSLCVPITKVHVRTKLPPAHQVSALLVFHPQLRVECCY